MIYHYVYSAKHAYVPRPPPPDILHSSLLLISTAARQGSLSKHITYYTQYYDLRQYTVDIDAQCHIDVYGSTVPGICTKFT